MFLCRWWRDSCCWTSSGRMIVRFPSWLSKSPRLSMKTSLRVPRFLSRSWWNSWWKCRLLSVAVLQQRTAAARRRRRRRSCSLSRHSSVRRRNGPDSGSSLAPLPGRGGGRGRRGGSGRLLEALFFVGALGRLGFPAWFRRVYLSFHREVRLRFKLAAGLGVAWTRDGRHSPRLPS